MLDLPYPGLRPFQPEETHIYFGRETQTDELLSRLGGARFLAVTGPSGCGKSSLVNTGLIASLELGLLASAGERWQVARMRPRSEPMRNLADALIAGKVVTPLGGTDASARDVEFRLWVQNTLERGPLGLKDVLERHPLPPSTNLLVVVDQFEEIFRYRRMISQQEADAFVALLLRSMSLPDLPIYVVITMRSDFLGQCTEFPGLPEAINDGQFLTPRLTREQIQAAIEGPAGVYGGSVDPALTTRLLNAIGTTDDQLPVLQHALLRMWIKGLEQAQHKKVLELAEDESPPVHLDLETYWAVGGIDRALSEHADEAYHELDLEGQGIARCLFNALTERTSRNVDIRRPATVGEVAQLAGVPIAKVTAVADGFRRPDRSFIVPSASELPQLRAETNLDISHESLIRQWKRLAGWVEAEADAARMYRRLEDSALRWEANKADLLGDIELGGFLQWREERVPSEAWAKRYGSHFRLAMTYLERSEQERDRKRREEEQRQRERYEIRLQRQRVRAMGGGFVVTTLLTVFALFGWYLANENRALAERVVLAKNAQVLSNDAFSRKQYTRSQLMRLVAPKALGADKIEAISLLFDGLHKNSMMRKISQGPEGRINSVAFDGVGDRVALGGRATAGAADSEERGGVIMIRDAQSWALLHRFEQPGDAVASVGFSPDDRFVASGGYDGKVRIWDASLGSQVGGAIDAEGQRFVLNVVFGRLPNGQDFLLSTGEQAPKQPTKALIWHMADGRPQAPVSPVSNLEQVLAVDYASGPGWAVLLGRAEETVLGVLWDIDNNRAVSGPFPVFDCNGGDSKGTGQSPQECASQYGKVAISQDGKRLATLTSRNQIVLWNLERPEFPTKLALLSGHNAEILALRFHGRRLASSSRNGEIFLWDEGQVAKDRFILADGDIHLTLDPSIRLPAQTDWVRSLSFNHDGTALVSASGNTSMLWSIKDSRVLSTLMPEHRNQVWSLALKAGRLATGGKDTQLLLWQDLDAPKPQPLSFDRQSTRLASLSLDKSGTLLAAAELKGRVRIWKLESSAGAQQSPVFDDNMGWRVYGVALSPDGRFLAISGFDGELRVLQRHGDDWSPTSIDRTNLGEHDWRVTGWGDNLAFSDDGGHLYFGTEESPRDRVGRKDYAVRAVELPPPREPVYSSIQGDAGEIMSLAYAPRCGTAAMPCLAWGGLRNVVQIWQRDEHAGWRVLRDFEGHQDRISTVAISPDGKTIASGSRDSTIRLWDLSSGKEIAVFTGHSAYVNRVAFSDDGRWLYSASDDGNVIRLNVDFSTYQGLVCETIDRNPTCEEWRALDIEDAAYLQLCPQWPQAHCAD